MLDGQAEPSSRVTVLGDTSEAYETFQPNRENNTSGCELY